MDFRRGGGRVGRQHGIQRGCGESGVDGRGGVFDERAAGKL